MPTYNNNDFPWPNSANIPEGNSTNVTPNTASAPMPKRRKPMRPGQALAFGDWMKPSQAKAFKAGQDMSDPRAAYNAWLQMVTGGAIGGGGGRRTGGRGGGGGAAGAAGPGAGNKPWQQPGPGPSGGPSRGITDKPGGGGGLSFQPGPPLTTGAAPPSPWGQPPGDDLGNLKAGFGGMRPGGAPGIQDLLQILLGGGAEQGRRGMGAKG